MDKTTTPMNTTPNPKWYSDSHTSAWERVKAALQRDWEQTKNDMSSSAGRDLNLMFPMIAEVAEFVAARALLDGELDRAGRLNKRLPAAIRVGTMLEVPSLGWSLKPLPRPWGAAAFTRWHCYCRTWTPARASTCRRWPAATCRPDVTPGLARGRRGTRCPYPELHKHSGD